MKRILIIAVVLLTPYTTEAQRRTVIVPAPQPPNVPIDGGVAMLLIGGGIWGRKKFNNTSVKKY